VADQDALNAHTCMPAMLELIDFMRDNYAATAWPGYIGFTPEQAGTYMANQRLGSRFGLRLF